MAGQGTRVSTVLSSFDVGRIGGVTVVGLVGDHDFATAAELERLLDRDSGLVLSLGQAEFIDSAVVHAVFTSAERLHQRGFRLVIHLPDDVAVTRLVEVTGLANVIPCFPTLEQAFGAAGDCHGFRAEVSSSSMAGAAPINRA